MAGALGCAAASAGVFVSMPAQAACLTTLPGSGGVANNCVTYDTTSSPTSAILRYTDPNLSNNFWQLNFANINSANFSNWERSTDGTNFTALNPTFGASGVFTSSQVFTGSPGIPFYLRVKLSDTATLNTLYQFTILTNNNGYTENTRIADDGANNNYAALSRNFTRVDDPVTAATPGPLPLMGAAAAFGYSRKIRKAIRSAG